MDPHERWIFALVPFSVAIGIPAALGLIPGNLLLIVGTLMGCVLARSGLARGFRMRAVFFVAPIVWASSAGYLRFRTLDIESMLAAQSVFGPTVALEPLAGAIVSAAAFVGGLAAGVLWLRSCPRLGEIETVLRLGEAALIATIVTTSVWGSPFTSVGALSVALTALVIAAAVSLVWFGARWHT